VYQLSNLQLIVSTHVRKNQTCLDYLLSIQYPLFFSFRLTYRLANHQQVALILRRSLHNIKCQPLLDMILQDKTGRILFQDGKLSTSNNWNGPSLPYTLFHGKYNTTSRSRSTTLSSCARLSNSHSHRLQRQDIASSSSSLIMQQHVESDSTFPSWRFLEHSSASKFLPA